MRKMKRAVIIAKGKVQKVGYRDFVQDSAKELGITGYVENLEDGDVKIVCDGKEKEINDFIKNIKVKKGFIDVSEILVRYEEPTDEFKIFKIMYGDVAEELGDRLGAAMLYLNATNQKIDAGFGMLGEKQDKMLEKQDIMIDKQDIMIDKQDIMIEKQDIMIDKQDIMIDKQDQMLDKQDIMIDKQDQMLDKQDQTIGEIKGLRQDLKTYMEERFDRLEHEIGTIKTRLGMA
jgi:acylphosphatase